MKISPELFQELINQAYALALEVHYQDVPEDGAEQPLLALLRFIRTTLQVEPDCYGAYDDPQLTLGPESEQPEAKRYTVLAFTEQGIRGLKVQAQGRIEQHREDIERLNKLRTWLLENGPDNEGPTALVVELTHHLEGMFDSKVSELEESITALESTVAELEQGGY